MSTAPSRPPPINDCIHGSPAKLGDQSCFPLIGASDHSVAGGETVSTFLAGTTCFLLQHPHALDRLTREIRQAFSTYAEIHVQAAQQLPFLQAVINEGLRLYPPGPQGFPRISPGFTIHGRYVPEGVSLDPSGRPSMSSAMKLM